MKGKVNDSEDIFNFLMSNKDFRDWVLCPTDNRCLYWEKWTAHNDDHLEEVQRAKSTILGMRFKEDFLSEDKLESMLGKIIGDDMANEEIHSDDKGSLVKRSMWLMFAASLILILALGFLFLSRTFEVGDNAKQIGLKEIVNPKGQKSKIKLPDGSSVILNGGSSIRFSDRFDTQTRLVTLEGEAYFDVVEDLRPFIVESNGIKTKVLGTKFNVRAFNSEATVNVSLVEGKVAIEGGERGEDFLLSPGETAVFNKTLSAFRKSTSDLESVIGWKDGILIFNDSGFEDFVSKIESWYGVDVIVKSEPSRVWKVNGKFKNESLETVLLGVKFTHDMRYKIEGKRVVLF